MLRTSTSITISPIFAPISNRRFRQTSRSCSSIPTSPLRLRDTATSVAQPSTTWRWATTEYNLALGDNRAGSVKNALVGAGISADRIKTVSYGKEKPFCTESNEACWQQNRRGHFVYSK